MPGPWLSGILDNMVDWQWQNVGADKEAATAWVLNHKEALILAGAVVGVDKRKGKRGKKEKEKEREKEKEKEKGVE